MKDAEYQAIAYSVDDGNVWWADDRDMLAFAHKVRAAALEEAAKVAESECDNWDEELSLRICAKSIRSMKS